MGKIYITRHGETKWNIVRRIQGQLNSPLTILGIKQAKWLAERLINSKIDIIYSSSLPRAMETANIIKGNRQIKVIPRDDLREINLGDWQGQLITDVEKNNPKQHTNFWKKPEHYIPDSGEGFEDLSKRVGSFFDEILDKHPNDNVLIVAHAIIIKALLNYINHGGEIKRFWEGPNVKPTSLTKFRFENGKLKNDLLADTSHYKETNTVGWFMDEDD